MPPWGALPQHCEDISASAAFWHAGCFERRVPSATSRLALLALMLVGSFCSAAQIPFEFRDGLIWVKVQVSGSRAPLNFLLDSGAGSSVVDLSVARRLGVAFRGAVKVQRVGESIPAHRIIGFSAQAGGVAIQSDPLAVDLSDTSELCNRRIDGLIGHDFFRGRIVQIDFRDRCIRVLESVRRDESCVSIPLKVRNCAICVPVSMNGSRHRWTRLDTGCDGALHWVDGDGGDDVRATVAVGQEQIANVPASLRRSPLFPSEAGLLGNAILSNYRVTIDAVNGRLLLQRS
jgi:hypothetical protein